MEVLKLDRDVRRGMERGVEVLRAGGLVVYPTDTLYGLGCNALDEMAVKKVFDVKGRSPEKPLPIAVCDMEMMGRYALINENAERIAKIFLPGALTVVLERRGLPDVLTAGLPRVAVRIPKNNIALDLIRLAGFPITATSANVSGARPPITAEETEEQLKVDLILDAGKLNSREPSTILDLTGEPKVIREGVVKRGEIARVLGGI